MPTTEEIAKQLFESEVRLHGVPNPPWEQLSPGYRRAKVEAVREIQYLLVPDNRIQLANENRHLQASIDKMRQVAEQALQSAKTKRGPHVIERVPILADALVEIRDWQKPPSPPAA